jgi:hypothetical protein
MHTRLAPFLDAGLLGGVPTRWQVFQAELEMWGWVISTDVTDESRYSSGVMGHPVARQPFIFREVGLDHLRIGTGLGCALESIVTHLHLTWHSGMPAWDLQVIQTHPGGLDHLRARTEELLTGESPRARRHTRLAGRILADPRDYWQRFEGWIQRAEAMDYPSAASLGSAMPEEFHALVPFMQHASTLPVSPSWSPALPLELARRATRRFREVGSPGWGLPRSWIP